MASYASTFNLLRVRLPDFAVASKPLQGCSKGDDVQECEIDAAELEPTVRLKIKNLRSEVDSTVGRLMQVIRTFPCACEALDEIELALSEALANAIIHGNQEDPAENVEICGACEGRDTLILIITDEGHGFDVSEMAGPTRAENLLSTHGRGIFLIRRSVDEAEYRLSGRQIVLRKKTA